MQVISIRLIMSSPEHKLIGCCQNDELIQFFHVTQASSPLLKWHISDVHFVLSSRNSCRECVLLKHMSSPEQIKMQFV